MAFLGSGICSVECERIDEKENPKDVTLNITFSEIDSILGSAGVEKKHRQAVAKGWEDILAKKMPHLRRVVDLGDTKDVK
jgi:hypothetical protein